jgi:hypothetical protein
MRHQRLSALWAKKGDASGSTEADRRSDGWLTPFLPLEHKKAE